LSNPTPTNAGQAAANATVLDAFRTYEQQQRLINTRVGCLLVITLMPAGSMLDYFVYKEMLWPFLFLRLAASVAAAGILGFLFTEPGRRSGRWLGVVVPLIPVISIAGMIMVKEGFASPYYAGLNLVLLAIGAVLHWTVLESVVACALVLAIYITAGLVHGGVPSAGVLFNNFYFIALMDVIVVVGTYFAQKQRFREFSLRFELDANRAQLEESNAKLKELDQIKGRFFANISHELRTPLTLMISPLETILARYRNSLDAGAIDLLQTMHSNGLRLLKLINDLLDLVRLDSGVMQVRRESVALEPFLQGMASAARQVAEDKQIHLVVAIAPEVGAVMVDRDKLEKIVLNLQFNALKFTPAGGRVELRADKKGEELVLRVSDTGIGIPAKDLPNVFGRFFQVDSSARRKYQGVGIGLALVKEFVELHGGKVSVESVEGQGTTFTARMPYIKADPNAVPVPVAEAPPAPADAPPQPATGESAKAASTVSNPEWLSNLYHRANLFGGVVADKVATASSEPPNAKNGHAFTALIADDQPDMLNFIQSELAPHYNVVAVSDGQQAVDKAAAHLPDIILLDMMMPEKDGLQACREIRAAPATQNTPIILITAHVDEETKINALRAGASDFLPKPFSTTELHVRVRNLVESHDFQRKLARQNKLLETTIEQLKDTETRLVQTEKLASLGRLSAGIIHEINNPLNFAATGLFTLRAKARLIPDGERDQYAETLKDVEEGISRVKTIVSDLRTFTHRGQAGLEPVDVADAVGSSLRFLSQEWKNKVDVQLNLTQGQAIWADKNKLIQALINLLQNSLDAMKGKEFKDEKPTIVITGRVERGLNLLTVRDNGTGIAPEHIDKIFEPFFTTKDVGQGMGLGLSICYRTVEDFGGRIVVHSEQGKCCEFTMEFPLHQSAAALQP
jgi:signal transduction histidine kinase